MVDYSGSRLAATLVKRGLSMLIRRLAPWCLLIALASILGVTACGGGESSAPVEPTTTATAESLASTPIPSATVQPSPSPVPTATSTPAPTPTSTPQPDLTPAQVFSRISPSIAFIETPTGSGSGVLIDDEYVVTNSHVIWPYHVVRVVFPDGSELKDVPVVNSDPLADIAVLGPIDTTAAPLALEDGEDLIIGSESLLVGYPAEGEEFPQPTITSGILSRFREWEQLGMTYFQTDAALTGGQSGGALVNARGEVIEISGLRFSDAGFGLVASASDLAPIVDRLIRGENGSGLGDRILPTSGSRFNFAVDPNNYWDVATYIVDKPAGASDELELDGEGDGKFSLTDAFGNRWLATDEGFSGTESGGVTLEVDGPHFLQVGLGSGDSGSFELRSNVNLVPLQDPDDGLEAVVGQTIAANMDFHWDIDYMTIELQEEETIRSAADSANVDLALLVDFPGSRPNQVVFDNDSGGGMLGVNPEVIYRASKTGVYYIAVSGATDNDIGAYFLTVSNPPAEAEPVAIPPDPNTVQSPFGTMIVYESQRHDFSVQVPADWNEQETDPLVSTFLAASPSGSIVEINEENTLALGIGEISLEVYTDLAESNLVNRLSGSETLSKEFIQTPQGLQASRLLISALGGQFKRVATLDVFLNNYQNRVDSKISLLIYLSDY